MQSIHIAYWRSFSLFKRQTKSDNRCCQYPPCTIILTHYVSLLYHSFHKFLNCRYIYSKRLVYFNVCYIRIVSHQS